MILYLNIMYYIIRYNYIFEDLEEYLKYECKYLSVFVF